MSNSDEIFEKLLEVAERNIKSAVSEISNELVEEFSFVMIGELIEMSIYSGASPCEVAGFLRDIANQLEKIEKNVKNDDDLGIDIEPDGC